MRRPMWVLGLFWASLTLTVLVSGLVRGQAPSRRPEVWSIVVGVGNYTHSAIPVRPAPARDANRIHQWIKQAGWDDGHRILLSDSGNRDPGEPDAPALNILPTRRNLDWAFQRWLFTRKIQAGDIVVFYFAGESRTVVKPQGASASIPAWSTISCRWTPWTRIPSRQGGRSIRRSTSVPGVGSRSFAGWRPRRTIAAEL